MAAAIVSACIPAIGPALVEIWRYIRHAVNACRGKAADGKAARTRQGVELRTHHEELGQESMGFPQQHPDAVDGSFRRLYSKSQNGSASTRVGEHSELLSPNGTRDFDDGSSSLPATLKSDGASEEVPLSIILQQTHVLHSDAH